MIVHALRWLVTFASPYHAIWFAISMIWLIIAIAAGERGVTLHALAAGFHLIVVVEAAIMVGLVGYTGPVFSINCVWFNALMALIHWRLHVRRLRRLEKGSDP